MKITTKVNIKDIKTINLKGIEITDVSETSGNDMRSITLKDTITGTTLTFRTGTYSEFSMFSEKPPEKKKMFVLSISSLQFKQNFESDQLAQEFMETHNFDKTQCEVKEEMVEVQEG